jgi:hypothetical protein
MKYILIVGALIILAGGAYLFMSSEKNEMNEQGVEIGEENGDRVAAEDSEGESGAVGVDGKLKADTFSGTLEEVNTGCFADAECYVVVDGKHVTVLMGWSRDTVGSVLGLDGIGDLETHIGQEVEVYAQDKGDGTYTLYGSESFYVKLKSSDITSF